MAECSFATRMLMHARRLPKKYRASFHKTVVKVLISALYFLHVCSTGEQIAEWLFATRCLCMPDDCRRNTEPHCKKLS